MASNKKTDLGVAVLHATVWTISVLVFSGWHGMRGPHGMLVAYLLVVLHAIQDHTDVVRRWMLLIGQDQFMKPPMAPWSIIVVDNVWHIVVLWAVWRWVI